MTRYKDIVMCEEVNKTKDKPRKYELTASTR